MATASRRSPKERERAFAGTRRLTIPLTIATTLLARPARAQDAADLEAALAEPVVSTASQSAEDLSGAPATVTTISAEDLRRYGITTLSEAINFLSLGMVTQNNLDDGEIGARGVLLTGDYGDHVLLLVNGHAMNEQWDGTAYFGRGAGIPFELIDHIEVVLGPGSVLYGSQAMLGVINIVTKQAKDFEGFHLVGESSLFTSGRIAVGYGKEFTLFGRRGEITYELEYYDQSGPAFLFGPQSWGVDSSTGKGKCYDATCSSPGTWGGTPADRSYWTKQPDGYMRLVWGEFELELHAESFQRATPDTTYTAYNAADAYELDRFLRADLRHRWKVSSIAQLRSRIYADAYDYHDHLPTFAEGDCHYSQPGGCLYLLEGYSRWVGLEEQLSLDWLEDQSLTTLLGVDGRAIGVGEANDSYDHDFVTPPPYGVFDKSEYRIAAYGQQTWRPWRWLSLNVGARLDEDHRDDVDYTRLSPRAAVAVNPWKNGTLKVVYAEAFRAPTYYETSYTDNQTQIPNAALSPETVRSVEASFEQRLGAQRLFAGFFDAHYDALVLDSQAPSSALVSAVRQGILPPVSPNTATSIARFYGASGYGVFQYQNLSGVSDVGINAAFEGAALQKALRYGVNFTAAYSRQQTTNSDGSVTTLPLPVAPRVFGNARVSYDLPGVWPVVGLATSLVGSRPADYAFGNNWKVPPYAPTQVEFRATISGGVPEIPSLTYRFVVDYAVASTNPYVVGPLTTGSPSNPVPELAPVDQLRAIVGLQYDLR